MGSAATSRYQTLDHWRGLAALSVACFHAIFPWMAGPHPSGTGWIVFVLGEGWRGVHLFFVISGYCIAVLALREIRSHRLSGFFLANRFLRIFPPYWAACVVAAAGALAALPFNHQPLFAVQHADGALPGSIGSFLQHVFLLEPLYPGSSGYLLVAWTLSWELSFYLLAAGLILVAVVIHPRVAIALGLGLAVAATVRQFIAFWPALGGWAEFTCGSCVFAAETARAEGRPVWPWLLFVAGLGSVGWITAGSTSMLSFAAAFAFLLYGLRPYDSSLAKLPGGRWLAAVGVMSYSLYLTHVSIISPLRNLLSRIISPSSPWFSLPIFVSLGASIGGAWLFYRWVEAPVERWRKSHCRLN